MLAAGVFEWAQHQGSATAVLEVARQILPSHGAHATLVGARHRQPRALVLVALGPQRQREAVSSLTPCYLPRGPQLRKGLTWMVSKTNSLVQ